MASDPSADLNQPLRALLGESTAGAGRNKNATKDDAASTSTSTSKVGGKSALVTTVLCELRTVPHLYES